MILVTAPAVMAFGATPCRAAGSSSSSSGPLTLAYRYVPGEVIRQTTRQVQLFRSESRPDLSGESMTVSRSEARVRDVDPNGTALLDELTTYEADEEKRDHRRFRTTRSGEILWVDIIAGEPSALQGGAIFAERPVRQGDAWRTRMKGSGGGPSYAIDLDVRLASLTGTGFDSRARLTLSGRMEAATVTAMLGESGIAQGIRGKECLVSGDVIFQVEAGKEISSRLDLQCDLEILGESGPPKPATLRISYETTNEGPLIPRLEAP